MLGQGAPFLPTFSTGVNPAMQQMGAYQQPGALARVGGAVAGAQSLFSNMGGIFGGNQNQSPTGGAMPGGMELYGG